MNESWYDKLFFFPRKISVLKYVWSKPMNPTLKEYPGYAGFLKRFLAGIVDLIFLSVIVVSIITAYIIFEIAPNFNSSMHKIFSISFLWEPFFTSGVLVCCNTCYTQWCNNRGLHQVQICHLIWVDSTPYREAVVEHEL